MDKNRRKELMEAYKQMKFYMGVYQIKNNEIQCSILLITLKNSQSIKNASHRMVCTVFFSVFFFFLVESPNH